MQATTSLPPGYVKRGTVNITKSPWLFILLNLLGVVLLLAAGALFVQLGYALRPEDMDAMLLDLASGGNLLPGLLMLLAVMLVMVVVHEAIHGFFFWRYTRARPAFGVGAGYAYAAAPGWYLPRNQYLLVGISPLLVITLLGALLLAVVPASLLLPVLALMVINASGAVGDLAVVVWLLTLPRTALATDDGDAVTVYVPAEKA